VVDWRQKVRILLDYRPALRERTGVGEFVHELARALARRGPDQVTVLSASWKHRPTARAEIELAGARIVHRRVPVRALTRTWNRLGWPPSEWLAGAADVVHSSTPLIVPARRAARVITINDLDFLAHPERAEAEMRRDFPVFVRDHARRADHIVVPSHYTARMVSEQLDVPPARITVCPLGAPAWAAGVADFRRDVPSREPADPLLFVGTVEPRKNVATMLEAYALLRQRRADAPPLVLAGGIRPSMSGVLARLGGGPLAGHLTAAGYVTDEQKQALYRRARMLVLVSHEEGFGLPVLEAMTCGVPVVISNRGALPEVAGDAASPLDPADADAIAKEMERLLDPAAAASASARGLARAGHYSWDRCAEAARAAYQTAIAHRAGRAPSTLVRAGEVF